MYEIAMLAVFILVASFAGCTSSVPAQRYQAVESLCSPHGGVKNYSTIQIFNKSEVDGTCNDGVGVIPPRGAK